MEKAVVEEKGILVEENLKTRVAPEGKATADEDRAAGNESGAAHGCSHSRPGAHLAPNRRHEQNGTQRRNGQGATHGEIITPRELRNCQMFANFDRQRRTACGRAHRRWGSPCRPPCVSFFSPPRLPLSFLRRFRRPPGRFLCGLVLLRLMGIGGLRRFCLTSKLRRRGRG